MRRSTPRRAGAGGSPGCRAAAPAGERAGRRYHAQSGRRSAAAGLIRLVAAPFRVAGAFTSLVAALLPLACGGSGSAGGSAAEVSVAVAANFADVLEDLAGRFETRTGHHVVASAGATGQLYAQVVNGAPFHVFLSADAERPRLLEASGLAVPGTRFTYAVGRLALYGPGLDSVRADGVDLRGEAYRYLAMANPVTAPYGAAAAEVLAALGLEETVRPRIVQGESIAQTLQFVRSGAAELGFVALSQVVNEPSRSYWLVPATLHAPIQQDAVLLRSGEGNAAALAFLEFLRSPEAREVIRAHGYDAGGGSEP